jgi:uncharacterized protein with HEPN domain
MAKISPNDEKIIINVYKTIHFLLNYLKQADFDQDLTAQYATLFCLEYLGEELNPGSIVHTPISPIFLDDCINKGFDLPARSLNSIRNALMYNYSRDLTPTIINSIIYDVEILQHRLAAALETSELQNQEAKAFAKENKEKARLPWEKNNLFAADFYQAIGAACSPNSAI